MSDPTVTTSPTFVDLLDECLDRGVEHVVPRFCAILQGDEEWLREVAQEHLERHLWTQAYVRAGRARTREERCNLAREAYRKATATLPKKWPLT